MVTTHDPALPPEPILLVFFVYVGYLFSIKKSANFQDGSTFPHTKCLATNWCWRFRYLDLDDIIEESSIETDDGAEEEEEDSDG